MHTVRLIRWKMIISLIKVHLTNVSQRRDTSAKKKLTDFVDVFRFYAMIDRVRFHAARITETISVVGAAKRIADEDAIET